MLYLNWKEKLEKCTLEDLTLTSVVFEYKKCVKLFILVIYLTLTSVVFEFSAEGKQKPLAYLFNFNKCCI